MGGLQELLCSFHFWIISGWKGLFAGKSRNSSHMLEKHYFSSLRIEQIGSGRESRLFLYSQPDTKGQSDKSNYTTIFPMSPASSESPVQSIT